MVRKLFHKRPKGFKEFTEHSLRNGLIDDGFLVRTGRNPHTKMGGKVVFFKKKRRSK